jgi:hypothetical protein
MHELRRRVSLRELVTDLAHMFVAPSSSASGKISRIGYHAGVGPRRSVRLAQQAFAGAPELFPQTGSDNPRTAPAHWTRPAKKTLGIAWPQEGDIGRGLNNSCQVQTYWAQVIADAEDCATFAYYYHAKMPRDSQREMSRKPSSMAEHK